MKDRLRKSRRWLRKNGVALAAAIGFGGVVALLVTQLDHGPPDSTTLVLLALALALLFGFLAPRESGALLRRMTNFKVAGVVEVGLETVVRAEVVRPPGDEGDGVVAVRDGEDLEAIVRRLKMRLRFIYDVADLRDRVERKTSYQEIVHVLAADRLVDHEEAQFLLDLLSDRDLGLAELPLKAQDEFLDAAWSFATRFHFMIWDRFVRVELADRGWLIVDFRQARGHRRDFLACWNGEWAVMSARVGGRSKAWRYPVTSERLAKTAPGMPIAGRCIVIPAPPKKKPRLATVVPKKGEPRPDVKVLELQGSLREHPERAFERNGWNQDALRPSSSDN